MDLVAYLRVSSVGQAQDGYGLDVQAKAVKAWAKANGHRIVATHTDVLTGAKDAVDRPGLLAALDAVGPKQGLVIPRLDRLARALHVQEAALAIAWQAGARVFSADTGEVLADDPDDPMRTAMRQMAGVFAELDRRMIVKRMRDGRRAKAEAGRKATGAYAYGYAGVGEGRDKDAAPLPDDHPEARAVELIRTMREAGASYRAIAEALDAEGLPPRRAASWSAMSVRAVALRMAS